MKRLLVILGTVLVVGALGLMAVGAVFAQGPTDAPQGTPWGRAWGHMSGGLGAMHEVFADLLGMTPEELWAERAEGKTLVEIAEERGVDEQELIDAMAAAKEEALDEAVAAGQLSEEQAEWMLERFRTTSRFGLTEPFGRRGAVRGGFRGMMRGRGGARGFGGPCFEALEVE